MSKEEKIYMYEKARADVLALVETCDSSPHCSECPFNDGTVCAIWRAVTPNHLWRIMVDRGAEIY